MFYFLFIFKPIDKLFLVVLLCEQLKLQAFQTIKKLKREPSDNTLLDQRLTKQRLQNKSQFVAVTAIFLMVVTCSVFCCLRVDT